MIGIGLVGIGFMGMTHFTAARRLTNGQVVAIASRDPAKRAGDWTSIQGNFGPRGSLTDLSGVNAYAAFEDLLADSAADLVDLCVPNQDHARMAVQALEAGKHVLVEQPIALSLIDADRMLGAADKAKRQILVAHVLPFVPEFAFAAEVVRSGRYGRLKAAHLIRVIARRDGSARDTSDETRGGPALDPHIHETHFLCWLRGKPSAVHSTGVVDHGEVLYLTTQYEYENDGPVFSSASGAISQPGRSFAHGLELYLERATVTFSSSHVQGVVEASPLTVFLSDCSVERPEFGTGYPVSGFVSELGAVVDVLSGERSPGPVSATLARQALAVCLAEMESVKRRETIAVG